MPPRNIVQDIAAFMLAAGTAFVAIRLMAALYNVCHAKCAPLQSRCVIQGASIASMVFIAGAALGFITVSHSWLAIIPVVYFAYGGYVLAGLRKNRLIPRGFVKRAKDGRAS